LELPEELKNKLFDHRPEEGKYHIPFQQKTLQELLKLIKKHG